MHTLSSGRAVSRIVLYEVASCHRPRHVLRPASITLQQTRSSSSVTPRRPQNKEIQHRVVQLVDPETGRLHPPTLLSAILASVNPKTHFVELATEDPNPLVKIVSKEDLKAKIKEQRLKKKLAGKSMEQKEIQLTWGVAAGDLEHKLSKVRRELEKGNRVDLVYAPKKGQPLPNPAEMELRMQETVEKLADVGKEWKPKQVQKHMSVIYFQGHTRTQSSDSNKSDTNGSH